MDTLKSVRLRTLFALTLGLTSVACGSDEKEPTQVGDDGDDGTPGDNGGGNNNGDGNNGGDGNNSGDGNNTPDPDGDDGSDGTDDDDLIAKLPYHVSDGYGPSGYMGAAAVSETVITAIPNLENTDTTCGGDRAPNAGGTCYTFTATYEEDVIAEKGWAGVFWLFADSWGGPGLEIEPGATKISFQAKAEKPVELKFAAGVKEADGRTVDGWTTETDPVTLTTEWKQYEISLEGIQYTRVTGGFAWAIAFEPDPARSGAPDQTQGSYTFQLDDIKWTK